jgi:hypothetical protein
MEQQNVQNQEQIILKKKARQRRVYTIILILLGASLFLLLTTMYSQYEVYTLKRIQSVKEKIPTTTDEYITALSRHILIPEGTPQVASIKDVERLKSTQPFFKDALNGDVIIVIGSRLIIYRPNEDVIVGMGDMNAGATTTEQ